MFQSNVSETESHEFDYGAVRHLSDAHTKLCHAPVVMPCHTNNRTTVSVHVSVLESKMARSVKDNKDPSELL